VLNAGQAGAIMMSALVTILFTVSAPKLTQRTELF